MIGQRFGNLVVEGHTISTKWGEKQWVCRCDCGAERIARGKHLRSGSASMCVRCARRYGAVRHGGKGTRLYRIWSGMRTRCFNSRAKDYPRYGGAGISVCQEWISFPIFSDWAIQAGYTESSFIDRIDASKGYEPANCRWVTAAESSRHTRAIKLGFEAAKSIRILASQGKSHAEIAKLFGVCRASVSLVCEGKSWV